MDNMFLCPQAGSNRILFGTAESSVTCGFGAAYLPVLGAFRTPGSLGVPVAEYDDPEIKIRRIGGFVWCPKG